MDTLLPIYGGEYRATLGFYRIFVTSMLDIVLAYHLCLHPVRSSMVDKQFLIARRTVALPIMALMPDLRGGKEPLDPTVVPFEPQGWSCGRSRADTVSTFLHPTHTVS